MMRVKIFSLTSGESELTFPIVYDTNHVGHMLHKHGLLSPHRQEPSCKEHTRRSWPRRLKLMLLQVFLSRTGPLLNEQPWALADELFYEFDCALIHCEGVKCLSFRRRRKGDHSRSWNYCITKASVSILENSSHSLAGGGISSMEGFVYLLTIVG